MKTVKYIIIYYLRFFTMYCSWTWKRH